MASKGSDGTTQQLRSKASFDQPVKEEKVQPSLTSSSMSKESGGGAINNSNGFPGMSKREFEEFIIKDCNQLRASLSAELSAAKKKTSKERVAEYNRTLELYLKASTALLESHPGIKKANDELDQAIDACVKALKDRSEAHKMKSS